MLELRVAGILVISNCLGAILAMNDSYMYFCFSLPPRFSE